MRKYFDAKDPNESVVLKFDFTLGGVPLIGPATVVVTVDAGEDANPSALLNGAASVGMSEVSQPVTGGVAGVDYRVECRCDGMVLVGFLPVREV
jgi:hypothetical protein